MIARRAARRDRTFSCLRSRSLRGWHRCTCSSLSLLLLLLLLLLLRLLFLSLLRLRILRANRTHMIFVL